MAHKPMKDSGRKVERVDWTDIGGQLAPVSIVMVVRNRWRKEVNLPHGTMAMSLPGCYQRP